MVIRNKLSKERCGADKYNNLVLVNNEISNQIDEKDIAKIDNIAGTRFIIFLEVN